MSKESEANLCNITDNICQGDVFKDVKYSYIDFENEDTIEVVEYSFPLAIIISQGCDVISMGEMAIGKKGKSTKFMPALLLCPIYDANVAKEKKHVEQMFSVLSIQNIDSANEKLFNSNEWNLAKNDWHYRYHALAVKINKKVVLENALIDFKHYFTVPASYLVNNRQNRIFHLDDLFSEQVTLKFSTYLSRVAIP